jgi:hypothetical protein
MTDGQTVLNRAAALAAVERGQMEPCRRCGDSWRAHRCGLSPCGCGRCAAYTVEPELKPEDPRLWTSAERRAARQARRDQQAYESIYGKEPE